jgi:hypothetical protein
LRYAFIKVGALASTLFLGSALLIGAEKSEEAPTEPTAGEQFKNIKVLQELPANQLLTVMQEYNVALGVKCDFCHVQGDFSKDDNKHKDLAREMILLTRRLNEKEPSMNKKGTCFMCHHGRVHPARNAEEAKPKPAPKHEAKPNENKDEKSG